MVSLGVDGGLAVEDDHTVGQIRSHDEVVLDHECGLFGMHNEALDDSCRDDALFGIEVSICQ